MSSAVSGRPWICPPPREPCAAIDRPPPLLSNRHRALMAPRLLVVSNRAPVEVVHGPEGARIVRTVGGLAGALDDALRARGGEWIAWIGPQAGDGLPAGTSGLPYPIRAVRLKEREINNYYAGF